LTPEEWREAKALLAEALELPADRRVAWLELRCGDDPLLRRELEALLAASEGDGFLDGEQRFLGPAIAAGEVLGPYRIDRKLAEGGMGEVYQAFDSRLERRVAIKVLPAHLSRDASALMRFERETKALAALSHPNILAIFDVGRHGGTAFAVTELLTGATLRERIERGRLPVATAVEVAAQAARGLAVAHAEGVVHRDLKPENLFVTASGQVKVLDFGIATFTAPPAGADSLPSRLTAENSVIGTARYMSPEQAQGKRCDHRTDLFSLGAVLYEMLTGSPAFPGETPFVVLRAVLDLEPVPLGQLCPAVGPQLVRLVHRCLAKEPARRFQSASDLAFHLETLGELPANPASERSGGGPRRRWLAASLAAAICAAGASLGLLMARPAGPPPPPRIDFLTHNSSDSGPASAPDGRTVAFVSGRDGRSRIWLKQIATGDERPLTEGIDSAPRFSPDGQMLLFTRDGAAGPGLYRIGLLGGEPQPIVSPGRSGAWSPDGRRVAFVREHSAEPRNQWSIGVVALDGSGERLFAAERAPISHLWWSRDGRFVWAVRRRSAVGAQDDFLRVDVESGRKKALAAPESGGQISRPAWGEAGRTLLFAQTGSVTGYLPASRVVIFAPDSGRYRTLFWFPNAIDVIEGLGADRLIFDAIAASQNIGEAAPAGGFERQRWLTRGTGVDRQPNYSPDGKALIFSSNRSGNIDLWALSTETGSLKRLTEDPADDWDPAFSPDGRLLAWSSNRNGAFEIFVAEADGRNPRQLTAGNLAAENPTFTADGEWVVYSADRAAGAGIRRVRLDRTRDLLITASARGHPEVSPDGRYVVVRTHTINDVAELRVVGVESGAVLPESARLNAAGLPADRGITLGRARWLPGGREVAFIGLTDQGCVGLLAQSFDPRRGLAGPARKLRDCSPDLLPESFAFARDGRLAVSYLRRSSNLMAASGLDLSKLRP
jgi:eukaryotic-like serine/threonine-protein kinase